jgi:hypothetical protein
MVQEDKRILPEGRTSYNGVLANMWRLLLNKAGVDTEGKLELLIAMEVSKLAILKKMNSKDVKTFSPSALKQSALSTDMTFKSFIHHIVTLLQAKKLTIKVTITDKQDKETEVEYEVDL